jgi:hypothetical protein
MSPAAFEPTVPVSERRQTQALDRTDSGIDTNVRSQRKKKFQLLHHTDDTHHLHSGLELTMLLALVITPQIPNNVNSHDFNIYPFLAYIYII